MKKHHPKPASCTVPNACPFPYADYASTKKALLNALVGQPFYALITGSSGMGKTSLLRDISQNLDRHRHQVLYVSCSYASPVSITYLLANTLHISSRRCHLETLQVLTEAIAAQPINMLLWIDEADQLDLSILQGIRMLAEPDYAKKQILSVVFSGLPQLIKHIDAPSLFALKRRIVLRHILSGLRHDELDSFLEHRFGFADAARVPTVIRDELFERTQATPALIDCVVRQALIEKTGNLDAEDIRVVLDSQGL